MTASVQFDSKHPLIAEEIRDVIADGVRAAELRAGESSVA
jgi:hypothetical protein